MRIRARISLLCTVGRPAVCRGRGAHISQPQSPAFQLYDQLADLVLFYFFFRWYSSTSLSRSRLSAQDIRARRRRAASKKKKRKVPETPPASDDEEDEDDDSDTQRQIEAMYKVEKILASYKPQTTGIMFMGDIELNLDEDGNDDLYAEGLNSGRAKSAFFRRPSTARRRTIAPARLLGSSYLNIPP